MTTCDKCGAEYSIGDWPFCKGGHGRPSGTVVSDSIPGGQLIENLGPDPVRVYSETERRRIMKERGLVDYVRHRDGSPLTSNWSAVTQKTLDDAAELVSEHRRSQAQERQDFEELQTLEMTITERLDGFRVRPEEDPL